MEETQLESLQEHLEVIHLDPLYEVQIICHLKQLHQIRYIQKGRVRLIRAPLMLPMQIIHVVELQCQDQGGDQMAHPVLLLRLLEVFLDDDHCVLRDFGEEGLGEG